MPALTLAKLLLCATAFTALPPHRLSAQAAPRSATVLIDSAAGRITTFRPDQAWGGALDGHAQGQIARIYTPDNLAAMASAGLGPVSYRLRTELAIEAWHWNPEGSWSDPFHRQGYWTSSDHGAAPIDQSYGYRLPRRGRTIDDANNDGYSRIADGDTASFWKSNPYLDPRYTGDSEDEHPQWLVVDLGASRPVNAARLAWGAPWATRYLIEYWEGDQSRNIDRNPIGRWRSFPAGAVAAGRGGDAQHRLAARAVRTRFVRVTLLESSHTASGGNGDPRDSLGFALREIFLGTVDAAGRLHDAVRHGTRAARQSQVLVSSTDPWHRESDRDENVVQPGLDLVFRSGLTHGLPALVPVAVLFGTPENAAAELRFLRSRGYPVPRIEMGEEPDGQRVSPEDYAALYLQFARALYAVDPGVTLGGPSWQNAFAASVAAWPERSSSGARATWIRRFLDYLESRGRATDFRFLSFEWYPFDDPCGSTSPQLARAPHLLADALEQLHTAGLPDSIPRILTEYGYSAYAGAAEVEISAALLNADALAGFFSHGGTAAYVYGYEPGELWRKPGCSGWGNNLLFLADDSGHARYRMPAYYAARLLTRAWADSTGGPHELFAAQLESVDGKRGAELVSAYALRRPDGRWGLLLLNRDPSRAWSVRSRVRSRTLEGRELLGPSEIWQYSRAQYRWRADGPRGHPVRDEAPLHRVVPGGPGRFTLPPWSITVVVGW